MPYEWAKNDCCSFVCDAIHVMTGTDTYADFRGTYTDEASAITAMQTITGTTDKTGMVEFMTHKFEMEEIPVPFAQRGDVVLLSVGEFSLAVVGLDGIKAVGLTEKGLLKLPLSLAVRAWKVGV